PTEAMLELDRISPAQQSHPDALEVKWTILSQQQRWDNAIDTARTLTQVAPERTFGWIHLSFALHELKRTQEAYDNLLGVLDHFPKDWLMRYNMACYACQLGALEEAQAWLDGAIKFGDKKVIEEMAKSDPDLSPLFGNE
ncbi:MAG: tetratricopeptide repeat protein, partial [Limisphaerales bacterium]